MAAITKVKARPVSPPGYEVNDTGVFTETIVAGEQLVISGELADGRKQWSKAGTSALEAHGIALMDGYSGGTAEVGIQGEMDGFSGMTAGTDLYPSASVAGGLDTTKPTNALNRVRAVGSSRIRYNYI